MQYSEREKLTETPVLLGEAGGRRKGEEVLGGAAVKTKNAMQLKAFINSRAKAAAVSPQLMLQCYMLERLVERVSRSRW